MNNKLVFYFSLGSNIVSNN